MTSSAQPHRRRSIALAAACVAFGASLLIVQSLEAHAVVFPRESTPGAYEKYVLRVPNERDVATTKVEIRFPEGVRVISFADVAGWTLQTITDSAGGIVGAVWTGSLPPQRFIEFPFVAVNPKTASTLTWPAYQTYADNQRVEWTGAEDSKTPASSSSIRVAAAAATAPSPSPMLWYLAGGAALLSLISLGLALRPASRT